MMGYEGFTVGVWRLDPRNDLHQGPCLLSKDLSNCICVTLVIISLRDECLLLMNLAVESMFGKEWDAHGQLTLAWAQSFDPRFSNGMI